MGERFRVELPALEEFAAFAAGQAEQAPAPEDLTGDPVFGSRDLPGVQAMAQAHYTLWTRARKLAGDVRGGVHAAESGIRTVAGNYAEADERGRQRLERAEAGLESWTPHDGNSGQQHRPGQSQPGQGGQRPQPAASPSGTEPRPQSGGGGSGDGY